MDINRWAWSSLLPGSYHVARRCRLRLGPKLSYYYNSVHMGLKLRLADGHALLCLIKLNMAMADVIPKMQCVVSIESVSYILTMCCIVNNK